MAGLTERQKRFAFEYVKDFNATKAYIRAGYSEQGADTSASKLLSNPLMQEEIEDNKETLATMQRLTPQWVLRRWAEIAEADPNELVSVRHTSCPKCYPAETRKVMEAAGLALDDANPECEKCEGSGHNVEVYVADTRYLKGNAKRLYAGAVKTKDGIKILMRDQDAAVKNIANFLGMEKSNQALSFPNGIPIPGQPVKPLTDMSDAELEARISERLGVAQGVSEEREPVTIDAKLLTS